MTASVNSPLLSICIPIYNRKPFLDRMLRRFCNEKELFEQTIQLFISDNCSADNLQEVCEKYQEKGLHLEYSRNAENLGMDGNFEKCFLAAKGKYVWILGSDDIPSEHLFEIILPILEKEDVTSIHMENITEGFEQKWYDNHREYLRDLNIMITFLSANIISTRLIPQLDISKYNGTYITQVPVYLSTILSGNKNLFLRFKYLQDGNDVANNGGYRFFEVFMVNYFTIWEEFVAKGALTKEDYKHIKRVTFERFHEGYIFRTLIGEPSQALDMSGCLRITLRYFGKELYFYHSMLRNYWRLIKYRIHLKKQKLLKFNKQ